VLPSGPGRSRAPQEHTALRTAQLIFNDLPQAPQVTKPLGAILSPG
jgi:hypothetical protein